MKKLFSFFMGDDSKDKNSSAKVAKERLQILIAKDGANGIISDDVLRKIEYEILEIVKKYITVSEDNIDIKVEHENGLDILGLNITLNDDNTKK